MGEESKKGDVKKVTRVKESKNSPTYKNPPPPPPPEKK